MRVDIEKRMTFHAYHVSHLNCSVFATNVFFEMFSIQIANLQISKRCILSNAGHKNL